ncbi:hypothetical protein R6Q57_014734 [Mikania cordata]
MDVDVDEIEQVYKFQRVCSNDNSSNPQKLPTSRGNHVEDHASVARLCGWPSSRIVRVSRASGGKDGHSKVLTSKGLRDRRVRLSVGTAIQFYDLQDRLGYDQPSKAVEWLLKAASGSIDELPSLNLSFSGAVSKHQLMIISEKKATGKDTDLKDQIYHKQNNNNNNVSGSCSSTTSETSKGSGLSLSRSENRVKARERARLLALKKEKDKQTDSSWDNVLNQNQVITTISENSSFTDLLTGGINTTTAARSPIDYNFNRAQQIPQFNIMTRDKLHQFQDSYLRMAKTTVGGSSFLATPPPPSCGGDGDGVAPGGFTRGTLQSNSQSSLLPNQQRFQSSSIDGSTNLPFFIVPNAAVNNFPATGGYHLSYGDGGGRHSIGSSQRDIKELRAASMASFRFPCEILDPTPFYRPFIVVPLDGCLGRVFPGNWWLMG